jgi:hypothetical protein
MMMSHIKLSLRERERERDIIDKHKAAIYFPDPLISVLEEERKEEKDL